MKKLNITWDGVYDNTGYMFSLAKSLCCAVKNSPWAEYAEDIVATSGFAFRMWVSADLCPSATSIWEFNRQPVWVESGGFTGEYIERLWGRTDEEVKKSRLAGIDVVKRAVDRGFPAISWDIGVPEWGLITGYDDETQMFATLAVNGVGKMPYSQLGERELPIMSVLTVLEKTNKTQEEILRDTMKLAVFHLRGKEWGDNAKGLEAYPALIRHLEAEDPALALSWNMEYFLGTYGALKYYAWKYFEKMKKPELAAIYKAVHDAWQEAFHIKKERDVSQPEIRTEIAALLKSAYKNEGEAVEIMER